MGHGTVADEVKGRAPSGTERAGQDPRDRGGRGALPLLPRRRRAVHRPRDVDADPGEPRLRHRARVRRVHAVPRRARVHAALDRAHAPLARPLPGLARRARPARTSSSTASCRAGCYEDLRVESTQAVAARACDGIAIGGSLGDGKEQMYEVVGWATGALDAAGDVRPRHLLGIGEIDDLVAGVAARHRHVRLRDADAARRGTAWRSSRTRRGAGASTSPRRATATPTSRSWRAARARPARSGGRAATCATWRTTAS